MFTELSGTRRPKRIDHAICWPAGFKAKLESLSKKKPRSVLPSQNTVWAQDLLKTSGFDSYCSRFDRASEGEKNRAGCARCRLSRADKVVQQSIQWLCKVVVAGAKITEWDFAACRTRIRQVRCKAFLFGSSVLPAKTTGILLRRKRGGGASTWALTSTKPTQRISPHIFGGFAPGQSIRRTTLLFTTVLKSAIAGMTATLPTGFRGYQLDTDSCALARRIGFSGTEHGVGSMFMNFHPGSPRPAIR